MKVLNHYEVKILKDRSYPDKFTTEYYSVKLENEKEVVIERYGKFWILDKEEKASGSNDVIGVKSISEWRLGLSSLDGIHYSCYTYEIKNPVKIKAEIESFIKEKYGYLFSVNLDFIK